MIITMRYKTLCAGMNGDSGLPLPAAEDQVALLSPGGVTVDRKYFKECSTFCGLRLMLWCRFVALVHIMMCFFVGLAIFLQEVGTFERSTRLRTPLTRTVGLWVNATLPSRVSFGNTSSLYLGCDVVGLPGAAKGTYRVEPLVVTMGALDNRYLILAFFLLPVLFQIGSFWGSEDDYYGSLKAGNNRLSYFVEYSLSISLMILVISAQLGVTDGFTLMGAVCNVWCFVLFGLLTEILHRYDAEIDPLLFGELPAYLISHLAGWVPFVATAASTLSNVINYESCVDEKNGDLFWDTLKMVAFVEVGLVLVFGLVLSTSIGLKPCRNSKEPDTETDELRAWWACLVEWVIIVLGLVSRIVLGIAVYSANLV